MDEVGTNETSGHVAMPAPMPAPIDPHGDMWEDDAFRMARDEWLAEAASDHVHPDPDLVPAVVDECTTAAFALDVEELDAVARSGRMIVADQYVRVARIVRDAAAVPEGWVGPDPMRDPHWTDPRGRTAAEVRRERADLAVRAAVLDVAVRLRLSETTVRSRAAHADILRERAPRVWAAFVAGDVAEQQAQTAARLAASLPADSPHAWAAFDERVAPLAVRLPPAKFAVAARTARERVHPESIDARHTRAASDRGVWVTPELDGMARLEALLPADRAWSAHARIDAIARHLSTQHDESRTLAQLRADVLASSLANDVDEQGRIVGEGVTASVAVTVPALTLLGRGDEPAVLDGYGPIDLDTAKRLAGGATSWFRILTHPVSGVPLTLDRTTYRVPAALRAWLGVVHPTCTTPGCLRSARHSDMDHRVEWRHGGATDAHNLGPQCPPHHPIKTESRWHPSAKPDGSWQWVSPTGHRTDLDPPPF